MKRALILLFFPTLLVAEPPTLKLEYKEGDAAKYPEQIHAAFTEHLATDTALAGEFAKFSVATAEAEPLVTSLIVSESGHTDFQGTGGTEEFKQTIALFYRFDERTRYSRSTTSGFFAMFTVTGALAIRTLEDGELEITKSDVTAKFEGFSRTLTAPSTDQ